jgi:SAM-dependent methyltransferase
MNRLLSNLLSAPIRLFARLIYSQPIESNGLITSKRPESVTPKGNIPESNVNFEKDNRIYLTYFQQLCGLEPHHVVLDVGCGIGGIAIPLTHFLNEKGSYEGFDISKNDIDWCNKNISEKHPNFYFQYSGLDKHPNKTVDKTDACHFIFPYDDAKFDFVCLISLFTHLMPAEIENYITEISRVMKPGATALLSLFIINCESEDMMIKKPTQMNFPYNKGFYRLHSLQVENKQVAYDEEWLLEKLSFAGLKMEGIKYGSWCGRNSDFDHRDLLICRKI